MAAYRGESMPQPTSNIVLITVDCLRYDRCGFTGHHRDTTPTLDDLAGESFIFDRAYSTGTYTTESVPGMMAGLHSYNGAYFGQDPAWKAIPTDHGTIASHLKSNGYETLAVVTNPHLSVDRNFDKGFDVFQNLRLADQPDRASKDPSHDTTSVTQRLRSRLRSSGLTETTPFLTAGRLYQYFTEWPSVDGKTLTDEFLGRLEQFEQPFFAWTHFMDIHRPIYPDVVGRGSEWNSPSRLRQFVIDAHAAQDRFNPEFESIYDHAVRYVDSQINRIIEQLRRTGAIDNTIILVTSDHGEALFDRGRYGHPRHYMFTELLHVPVLVRRPNSQANRCSSPFSLAWLGELIADVVDVPRPDFPAESKRESHLTTNNAEETVVVSDALDAYGHSISVMSNDYKYVTRKLTAEADPSVVYTPSAGGYRSVSDWGERHILDPIDIPNELIETAHSLLQTPSELQQIEGGFSRETERQLEHLGYKM